MLHMRSFLVALLVVAIAATTSYAGTVDLVTGGGADCGWTASWDSSLDGLVDIVATDLVGGDTCVIQKTAEFTQGPSPGTGLFPSIPITFTQTDPGATPIIAIDDEIITNNTGTDWLDFHMILVDHGDVVFDPVATAASGGALPIGWTISPFTNAAFSDGDTRLDIDGGVVPDGTQWFPGDGATNGELYINIDTSSGSTIFTLKETPTPEPGTLSLLAVGSLMLLRRRR